MKQHATKTSAVVTNQIAEVLKGMPPFLVALDGFVNVRFVGAPVGDRSSSSEWQPIVTLPLRPAIPERAVSIVDVSLEECKRGRAEPLRPIVRQAMACVG